MTWWREPRAEGASRAWSVLWPVAWLWEAVAGGVRYAVEFTVAQWRFRGDPRVYPGPRFEDAVAYLDSVTVTPRAKYLTHYPARPAPPAWAWSATVAPGGTLVVSRRRDEPPGEVGDH